MLNFAELYKNKARANLMTKFGYKNVMEVPRFDKVIINVGAGDAVLDSKVIDSVTNEIGLIAGQKPIVTKARKSIATFKLREGMSIGCKVTLRKKRMFSFLERLVYLALPRSREFKGFTSKSFDGRGNFSFGIKEQIIFPEIDYDKVEKVRGMDITIVTTAKNNQEAKALLEAMEFPFYN